MFGTAVFVLFLYSLLEGRFCYLKSYVLVVKVVIVHILNCLQKGRHGKQLHASLRYMFFMLNVETAGYSFVQHMELGTQRMWYFLLIG